MHVQYQSKFTRRYIVTAAVAIKAKRAFQSRYQPAASSFRVEVLRKCTCDASAVSLAGLLPQDGVSSAIFNPAQYCIAATANCTARMAEISTEAHHICLEVTRPSILTRPSARFCHFQVRFTWHKSRNGLATVPSAQSQQLKTSHYLFLKSTTLVYHY